MKQALTLTTLLLLCILSSLPAEAQVRRTVEKTRRSDERVRVWVRDVPETAQVRVDRDDAPARTRVREIERPRATTTTTTTTRRSSCSETKTQEPETRRIVIVDDRRPSYVPAPPIPPTPPTPPAPPTVIYRDREVPQKKQSKARFHLQLGGAAHYTAGGLYDELDQFDRDMTSWQGEAMVGLRFDFKRRGNANVIGVWGRQGGYTDAALSRLMLDQQLPYKVDPDGDGLTFREVEVGFLFREWFRLSAGQGEITFTDVNQDARILNYYIATTGFSFRLSRSIKWNTNLTTLFGQEFEQFAFRPSMGLSFRFNAFRM